MRVNLKKGKEFPLRKFHPWVFSGALESTTDNIGLGEIIEVYSHEGQFLGMGYWNGGGIAIKILSFRKEPVDLDFWQAKLFQARLLRQELGLIESSTTDSFRIFNAEGDGVPGLIIDKYADNIVIQFQSLALENFKSDILTSLKKLFPEAANFFLNTSLKSELLEGGTESTLIKENNMRFRVDLVQGQKTGFFLDQRDNRQLAGSFAKNKNVLNAFSYSGGFSVSTLKSGAKSVVSIDSSAQAIKLLEENLSLNECASAHTSVTADVFDYLNENTEIFDFIILDPPAFCKHRDAVENAIKGYTGLNHRAMLRLSPNGVLMTYSCSQLVSPERFKEAVLTAATRAGRHFKVISDLKAAACHPVSLFHPEGEYLKGLLLIEA